MSDLDTFFYIDIIEHKFYNGSKNNKSCNYLTIKTYKGVIRLTDNAERTELTPATRDGGRVMTPKEMYELLTPENKEAVTRQIETLIALQSSGQSEPCFPR